MTRKTYCGNLLWQSGPFAPCVNACLDHPRFVGAHWFQWLDQPLTGRSDGENYQIGFVTVTDTPYPELVEAARDVAGAMYRRRSASAIPAEGRGGLR